MIAIVTPYPISSIEQSPPNPPANCKKFDSAAFVKILRCSDAPSNLTCIIHPTVSASIAFDSAALPYQGSGEGSLLQGGVESSCSLVV